MPWLETSLMDQRMQFIVDYQRGLQSVTELADRFAISRKTAYKWLDRHEADGAAGLADRSRRPHACPHETPPGHRRRRARGASPSSPVGGEEAPPHSAPDRSARELAGPDDRVRPAETTRLGAKDAAAPAALAPGTSPHADD